MSIEITETGMSGTHRAEAGRIAREINQQLRPGGTDAIVTVADSIALARLHAELAILDVLEKIRLVLSVAP